MFKAILNQLLVEYWVDKKKNIYSKVFAITDENIQ